MMTCSAATRSGGLLLRRQTHRVSRVAPSGDITPTGAGGSLFLTSLTTMSRRQMASKVVVDSTTRNNSRHSIQNGRRLTTSRGATGTTRRKAIRNSRRFASIPVVPPSVPVLPKPTTNAFKASSSPIKKSITDWIMENSGTIVLNCGSMCSLLAFTRTDIVELRALAMTGSITSIIYFATRRPINYLPMMWSSIFVLTNITMLYMVMEERNGSVHLTENQQRLYEEHFLPHGVTPKQFERLLNKATRLEVGKDYVIAQQGDPLDKVTLVYKGSTQAYSTAKRRITAASSEPVFGQIMVGGNAGAWIGEIHFLEILAAKDTGRGTQPIQPQPTAESELKESEGSNSNDNAVGENKNDSLQTAQGMISPRPTILSYKTTQEKNTLLQWSFEDLATLLESSSDMRSNMTRAMTAAVVGKVVNYTVERGSVRRPNWMEWLTSGQTFVHSYGNDEVTLKETSNTELDEFDDLVVDEKGTEYEGPPLHQLIYSS